MVQHNERIKLLANAVDRASTACATLGIIAPTAGYLYGLNKYAMTTTWLMISMSAWIAIAVGLHLSARQVLRDLQ